MRRFKQILWGILFYFIASALLGLWAALRHPEYTAEQIGYVATPNLFFSLIVLYFLVTYLSDRGWLPGVAEPPPTHKPFKIEDLPWPAQQEKEAQSSSTAENPARD